MNRRNLLALSAAALWLTACGGGGGGGGTDEPATPHATKPNIITVLGDSLSTGYGISVAGTYYQQVTPGQIWVDHMIRKVAGDGVGSAQAPVNIINTSLGGEFTLGALARLPGILSRDRPTHLLLATGTNDAWSNFPLQTIQNNLATMAAQIKAAGVRLYMLNIRFGAFGPDYAAAYGKVFEDVANAYGGVYVDVTEGVYGNAQYYQLSPPASLQSSDGVHLNDAAQPLMMANVWRKLAPGII